MWDVVWDQFSRSVRNISDNNWMQQLFGAYVGHQTNRNPAELRRTRSKSPKDNITMANNSDDAIIQN